MGGFGNGNGGGGPAPDFSEWDFRSPLHVKEAFLTLAGHQQEMHRQVGGINRTLQKRAEDSAERDGQLLAAIARVENQMKIAIATSEATAARVGRLENLRSPPSQGELHALRSEVAEIRKKTYDEERQLAIQLAKQEAHTEELRRKFVRVEDDLTETGQRYISDIIKRACEEPVRQISGNAGYEGAIVIEKVDGSN